MKIFRLFTIISLLLLTSSSLIAELTGEGTKETTSQKDWKKVSNKEWKQKLSSSQYRVCREGGTERAFSGEYNKHYENGVYSCSSCNTELFSSSTKFDSRTGWPSFYQSIEGRVDYKPDNSYGMRRTEIVCSTCGAHLGHVFNDGPEPTGKRYCVNSICLDFKEDLKTK